jgi:hypothetical protein
VTRAKLSLQGEQLLLVLYPIESLKSSTAATCQFISNHRGSSLWTGWIRRLARKGLYARSLLPHTLECRLRYVELVSVYLCTAYLVEEFYRSEDGRRYVLFLCLPEATYLLWSE